MEGLATDRVSTGLGTPEDEWWTSQSFDPYQLETPGGEFAGIDCTLIPIPTIDEMLEGITSPSFSLGGTENVYPSPAQLTAGSESNESVPTLSSCGLSSRSRPAKHPESLGSSSGSSNSPENSEVFSTGPSRHGHQGVTASSASPYRPRHACESCAKSFDTPKKLQQHRRSHRKNHVCQKVDCGLPFSTRRDLERHRKSKHTMWILHCPQCSKCYNRPDNLKRHAKNAHKRDESGNQTLGLIN